MKYKINEINKKIEEKIIVNNSKELDSIKSGDVIVFNGIKEEDNIIKVLKMIERNWLIDNKKTFIYNTNENIKIENYIYAVTMQTKIPDDLYDDVICKNIEMWNKYKDILSDKPLYLLSSKEDRICHDLTNVRNDVGNIDLIIAIDDEIDSTKLSSYCWNSFSSVLILITNKTNNLSSSDYSRNIRCIEL